MEMRASKQRWTIVIGTLVLIATIATGGIAVGASASGDPPAEATSASPAPDPGTSDLGVRRVDGTDRVVPVPDPRLGSEVRDLAIPLQDAKATVRGLAFLRPGSIPGSVVGGVSVVFDEASPLVQRAVGAEPDAEAVAEAVDPTQTPARLELGGRRVLAWRSSEVVAGRAIGAPDRSISRYVILLPGAIAMVTFDDVAPADAERYVAIVAGAQ